MNTSDTAAAFLELVNVVAKLRDPNGGCPWDLKQTHETLKQYLIEESYEVLDAIDFEPEKLYEELGDVLLQVVLHSQIASERKDFDIKKVCHAISSKLIRRHPHVFGDVEAKTSEQVLKNWEMIKQTELPSGKSILDGVPRGMPALQRSQRLGEKAARVGFEWPTVGGICDQALQEVNEFLEVARAESLSQDRLEDEFGDILFSLAQLARRLNINSEEALHRSAQKFTRRFKGVEERAKPSMSELPLEELDRLWQEVKAEEKAAGTSDKK